MSLIDGRKRWESGAMAITFSIIKIYIIVDFIPSSLSVLKPHQFFKTRSLIIAQWDTCFHAGGSCTALGCSGAPVAVGGRGTLVGQEGGSTAEVAVHQLWLQLQLWYCGLGGGLSFLICKMDDNSLPPLWGASPSYRDRGVTGAQELRPGWASGERLLLREAGGEEAKGQYR